MTTWPGSAALPALVSRASFARKSVQLPFATAATPTEADAPEILWGTGSPESVVKGSPADVYLQLDVPTVWMKSVGVETATGWVRVAIRNGPVVLTPGVAPALDPSLGNYFTLNITSDIAVVIAPPSPSPTTTQTITIAIRNSSGGVLSAIPTFSGAAGGFKFSPVTPVPNGKQVIYQFCWDPLQAFWYQVGTPSPAV